VNKKLKFRMDIKGLTEKGSFEGLLSPYGSIDQGGDVVERGAYTKTLKDNGITRPLLWQHKSDEPIGLLTLEDRPDGLWCKGQILLDIPMGKVAHAVLKAGVVKGLSIGYESIKDSIEKGIRHLKELKLYEGSIVTFPMATEAMVTAVKAGEGIETKGDFNDALAERQLRDSGYQMRSALCSALDSLFWSGLTKEEAVAGAETIIEQFSDAYLAYLPAYLDMLAERYGGMETWSKETFATKAGAAISTANKNTIQSGLDQIQAGVTTLSALIAEKAASGTSSQEAAEIETKHEPVEVDHSALQPVLSEIISLVSK
jgi:HK97 family phage prohead protease